VSTVGAWLARQADLPRLDRELLVGRAAGISRSQVLGRPERALTPDTLATLDQWAARRRAGEPLAYITGEREFWGLAFEVSPSVLVPRPETELLVEVALALAADTACGGAAERSWLDLGTGSGAVAISLAGEARARGWTVTLTATDISEQALVIAARNGSRHRAAVTWRRADWFDGIEGRFQLIVSNPPYIADCDPHLADLGCEPRGALAAGPDGLRDLRRIAAGADRHLHPGGWLILEHGAGQGAAVRSLLHGAGFAAIATLTDLGGRERVSRGRLPAPAASARITGAAGTVP
jgi:release factor glutamine methyltransferase